MWFIKFLVNLFYCFISLFFIENIFAQFIYEKGTKEVWEDLSGVHTNCLLNYISSDIYYWDCEKKNQTFKKISWKNNSTIQSLGISCKPWCVPGKVDVKVGDVWTHSYESRRFGMNADNKSKLKAVKKEKLKLSPKLVVNTIKIETLESYVNGNRASCLRDMVFWVDDKTYNTVKWYARHCILGARGGTLVKFDP